MILHLATVAQCPKGVQISIIDQVNYEHQLRNATLLSSRNGSWGAAYPELKSSLSSMESDLCP